MSSGCRAARSSSRPSLASAGWTPSTSVENRARACRTSSSVAAVDRSVHVSGAAAERVGKRQQNAADFLRLLLFERDDVVVDLDRAERLEKQAGAAARAAVDDSRNCRAMLAADDEDVAAVAVGHDLLLEILGRVAAAQVRFERSTQPRPLFSQAIAQCRELRAGVVDDFERRADLAADVGDLSAGTRRPSRRSRRAVESCSRTLRTAAHVASTDARNVARLTSDCGSRTRPSTASDIRSASRSSGACSPIVAVAQKTGRFVRRRERRRDGARCRSAAAAPPDAPRQAASVRSGVPPRRSGRIRAPSGHRRA